MLINIQVLNDIACQQNVDLMNSAAKTMDPALKTANGVTDTTSAEMDPMNLTVVRGKLY